MYNIYYITTHDILTTGSCSLSFVSFQRVYPIHIHTPYGKKFAPGIILWYKSWTSIRSNKSKCLCPLWQISQRNRSFMHLAESLKQKALGSSVIVWRHSEPSPVEIPKWNYMEVFHWDHLGIGNLSPQGVHYWFGHTLPSIAIFILKSWRLFRPPGWWLARGASKRPSGTVCVSAKLQGRRCTQARSKATWRQCLEGARLAGQRDTWANRGYTGAQKRLNKEWNKEQRLRPNQKEKQPCNGRRKIIHNPAEALQYKPRYPIQKHRMK